jgi:hypothetical protein
MGRALAKPIAFLFRLSIIAAVIRLQVSADGLIVSLFER